MTPNEITALLAVIGELVTRLSEAIVAIRQTAADLGADEAQLARLDALYAERIARRTGGAPRSATSHRVSRS